MIIGLLSDSHDRPEPTRLAVELLRGRGAAHLLHAGDLCGQQIIDLLSGGPAGFVWGNNDGDRPALARHAASVGVVCYDTFGELEIDGKMLAITHGDDTTLVRRILKEQMHDYLITGHTHIAHDRWQGRCRWINPGALHRATVKTAALLDLQGDTLSMVRIG